jgi:hypothetical protein
MACKDVLAFLNPHFLPERKALLDGLVLLTAVELSQVTGVGGWVCPISSSAMRI